ncbi:hypothetical protein FRAHR75_1130011 [Frankia sp. Hr75.2]|nr:hypothetical protein FRAHR75_1130011 [Frankia sp. Hr75.2]
MLGSAPAPADQSDAVTLPGQQLSGGGSGATGTGDHVQRHGVRLPLGGPARVRGYLPHPAACQKHTVVA